jgi:hypothetical protein
MRTLAWIFYLANRPGARPLQMEELQDLLVTEKDDTEFHSQYRSSLSDIIATCQSLVILRDEYNNTVGFSHFTVHEFLRNCRQLPDKSYIADVCLTYLSFPDLATGMSLSDEARTERAQKFKAAPFIARYFGFLFKELDGDIEIQKRVIDLLSSEQRFESILEMEDYEWKWKAGWWNNSWDETCAHIKAQRIILYLARHGLTKTLTSFIDGKIGG